MCCTGSGMRGHGVLHWQWYEGTWHAARMGSGMRGHGMLHWQWYEGTWRAAWAVVLR